MGKLVLFLKDASPVEIPLTKERVTIGRRADNDVCLPHPAVSGEHAAVVTILADSFLEDLGSTNGTLVNGRPVAKHFLRDRDQIDVGRQLIVYLADLDAQAEPPPSLATREDRRDLARRVEPVRTTDRIEPTLASAIDEDLGEALARSESSAMRSEPGLRAASAETVAEPAPTRATPHAPDTNYRIPTEGVAHDTTFDAELAAIRQAGRGAPAAAPREPVPEPPTTPKVHGRLRVLTGPSAGRVVDIARDEFVIGRVGMQVAALEWRDGALRLIPREGVDPPCVNGEPIPAEGREVTTGDGIEIAGTRLELVSTG
ncbi:MAG: FHA domain-containing protein [Betaproteobacteria bacterium]